MDNFMDKLAQKLSAQEMIKANSAAEAMEMKRLQLQIEEYEKILQEIRIVNLKNAEVSDAVQKIAEESLAKIKECQKADFNPEQLKEFMQEAMDKLYENIEQMQEKSDEYMHTESVKVYRNVQAVVADGFKEQCEKTADTEQRIVNATKGWKTFAIITMVLVVIDILVNILQIVGIF